MPAEIAEDSGRSQPDECPVCHDTGTMRWRQPACGTDGSLVLWDMEHPCVNGCGATWKCPAAERDLTVDAPDPRHPAETAGPTPAQVIGVAGEANALGTDFIVQFVQSRGFDWGIGEPDRKSPG